MAIEVASSHPHAASAESTALLRRGWTDPTMSDMTQLVVSAVGVVLLLGASALGSPASLATAFADAYAEFAPLYALYRSYADYLFTGDKVTVPSNLEGVCNRLTEALLPLEAELATQSSSQRTLQTTYVTHLRWKVRIHCTTYAETAATIETMPPIDLDTLADVADGGYFASISDLNALLQDLFSLVLEGILDPCEQWSFNVAFATRTLLRQEIIDRIDASIRTILLGSDEVPGPPVDLPDEIEAALTVLAEAAGETMTLEVAERIRRAAETLHRALLEGTFCDSGFLMGAREGGPAADPAFPG